MDMIKKAWDFVNGKKTYIVAVVGILFVLTQLWTGAITPEQAVEMVLVYLGLGTVRHGIAKK